MALVCVRSALCALALVVTGCSGAGNEDLFDDSGPASDTKLTSPAPSTSQKTPADTPSTPATPAPQPPDNPDTKPAACTQEIEPNDTSSRATPFTSSFCGRIDTSGDVDYGTFEVPQDAQTIKVSHTEQNGSVTYRYFAEGFPVPVQGDEIELLPGMTTYTVQIRLANTGGGKQPSYRIDLSFK
jgi:hypothetical protein